MLRATELAHTLIRQILTPGGWAIDATVGNGHDTLFLAEQVGAGGRIFGFDIQEKALASAENRLEGLTQITLHHAGHERMTEILPADAKGRIAAIMFNLGYLPGNDHLITTRSETTIAALDQALSFLAIKGLITLVLYTGHPGGAEEAAEVLAFTKDWPAHFAASRFTRLNSAASAPELLAIERLR